MITAINLESKAVKKKPLLYSILLISILSFISKIIGLGREGVVAAYLGTNIESDVFFLAFGIHAALTYIIGSSLAMAYLPIFVDESRKNGEEEAIKLTSSLLSQLLIFSLSCWLLQCPFFISARKRREEETYLFPLPLL